MKIVTIVGARPQFIKAAAVSRIIGLQNNIKEIIIHTGQHFDENMSAIFFNQLKVPRPNYNLNINSLSHGAMTGRMLESIEEILISETPDYTLVYGDTNSTLAGALASKKLGIKVIHVEAGLRSFNMKMPEEINRILTDRISDTLFCPTDIARKNLSAEGFDNMDCEIEIVGDVMYDAALHFSQYATKPDFPVPDKYLLCTIHRAENTNDILKLKDIFMTLNEISEEMEIVVPLHPRTKKMIDLSWLSQRVKIVDPVGYLQMIYLLSNCSMVITDSGGVQKEAYFFKKPCITLRTETEWHELCELGVNFVVGNDKKKFVEKYNYAKALKDSDFMVKPYGEGNAAELIVKSLIAGSKA